MMYLSRRFDEARRAFQRIQDRVPGDGVTRLYLKRLADREFLDSLPEEWDGSHGFESK